MSDDTNMDEVKTGLAWPARLGVLVSVLLLVSAFAWMWFTQISGAIIASGEVVVRGLPKQVQTLDGGVVDEIRVSEGDIVQRGDVLVHLDPSLFEINIEMYRNRLVEAVAREARLQSEYLGLDTPEFAIDEPFLDGVDLSGHIAGQTEIFQARAEVLAGRKEQLQERILQFNNQTSGVEALIRSKQEQLDFVGRELDGLRDLRTQGLARQSELLTLQRSESALLGEIAEAQSDLARIKNSIRDTELEVLLADREFKEQVVTELREASAEREELILQIVSVQSQLDRVDIVAPADGIVHQLQATTEGGVVAPEATIAQIIPVSDGVDFIVRIDPRSIDQVYKGQTARIVFPAFNMRTSPELFGEVATISPQTLVDEASGVSYYKIELTLSDEELALLGDVTLIPGMPVEAFLQTGNRSVLAYLTEPLMQQVERAFREG